jgi:hypothetical protein
MEPLLHIGFGGRDAERRTAADDAGRCGRVLPGDNAGASGHRSGDAFDLGAGNAVRSPHTRQAYEYALEQLFVWAAGRAVSRESVQGYVTWLGEMKLGAP